MNSLVRASLSIGGFHTTGAGIETETEGRRGRLVAGRRGRKKSGKGLTRIGVEESTAGERSRPRIQTTASAVGVLGAGSAVVSFSPSSPCPASFQLGRMMDSLL